ncbi:MAG: hypothetical protein B6245_23085 [Desulfobacteraceae bacterium 4572_88]|nr:MAG: hypothetical protein B6245_23085 [Desulfobacteraceae bacterium 4572_88]
MNRKMTISIASVPDREGLVAELWYDEEQWGEIFQEGDELRLALYPSPNHSFWNFDAEDAANTIQKAKDKLLETEPDSRIPGLEADSIIIPAQTL